jgi:dipeptidyl aminopeptidase/acylaminoacyl peptidase
VEALVPRIPICAPLACLFVALSTARASTAPAPAPPKAPAPAAARHAVTVDDLAKIHDVRDPQRSPDGKWIAYTVSTVNVDKDKRDTDIWMSSWDGAERIRLTSSPDRESTPRWSPDGKSLAFLRTRADDEGDEDDKDEAKAEVWIMSRTGGEAQKLTDLPGGVDDFAWSPDSRRLVLVGSDKDPDDDPKTKEGWKRKTTPPLVITRYHFKEDREGYLKTLYAHLYLFDIAAKKAEAITSGPYDDEDPSWSPDGTRIAFVSRRSADPDRDGNSDIFVVDARAGATPKALTTFIGPDRERPQWSPDGRFIAYLQGDEPRFYGYELNKAAIVPAAGGPARLLTGSLDRAVSDVRFTPDGKSLVFLVEDDRAQYVGRVPVEGGKVEALTSGRRVVSGISGSATGGAADGWAVIAGSTGAPDEVYALAGGALKQISRQNDEWLATVQLATTEDTTATASDGTVVHGLVTRPAGHHKGERGPMVLYIHGGPNGQDDYSFDFAREFLAANGYVVLQVNYRGGSGRGSAYQKAIYADWGHLEVVDLLAGVDAVVKSGDADPERLGIGGWSYGGILTNYTIATDPRFKAAVSGASSSLQTTMYGVDQYIQQYDMELGPPWKNKDLWLKVSYPFFNADRIKTPTLFLCGEKDFNVPIAGVENMYQALRSIGLPTELIIYPGQFHGLTVPSYQRDRLTRYVAWYDKYLKPAPKADAAATR